MTWVKIDDRFTDHPKFKLIGRDTDRFTAIGVHMDALCYCAQQLTDGELPEGLIARYPARIVAALVDAGVWDRSDSGTRVHDYLDYNPSREQVIARRMARADAGREGGMAAATSKQVAKQQGEHKGKQDAYPVSRIPLLEIVTTWGSEWEVFLERWFERYEYPPTPRQREVLWPIVDARPKDAAKWLHSAPPGKPHDAIGHVLTRWRSLRSTAS